MSSFGTKKPGADFAQQLTFPHIFAEQVAPGRVGYYPEAQERNEVLYPSHDLQGIYHQQKMEDAHRRALNGVADKKTATQRFLQSHAGYYGMPKAVLGQRKFANPSNGNQADIYNNRNVSFDMSPTVWSSYRPEGLSGGVLYTAEAQKWGRQKLRERVPQLNAIDAEREAFVNGLPVQGTVGQMEGVEGVEGSKVKLEIVATLRAILASVEAGKADAFAWNDTLKFMRLLFRWASSATEEELKEVLEYFDFIEEALIGIQEVGLDGREAGEDWSKRIAPNVDIMLEDFQKLREYITKMMEGAVSGYKVIKRPDGSQEVVETQGTQKQTAKSLKERKALSANLVKSIGFTTLKRASNVEQQARMVRDVERGDKIRDVYAPPVLSDNVSQFSDSWDGSDGRKLSAVAEAMRRYYDSVGFDANPRERIGRSNGSFFGEDSELVAPEVRNNFRQGTGEDQAQGLEVDDEKEPEEEEEEDESGVRSRASMGSRRAESAVAELSDAELRSRLGSPVPASSRSASVVAPAPAPIPRRMLGRPSVVRLTPDDVRQNGRQTLPNDANQLIALARRWKAEGRGDYNPRDGSSRVSVRKRLITDYNL